MMDKEIRFNPDSFKLVQANTRITDKKLETKPTTFAKDAFRRFCKNKSSIVAAFILAILILLTIFVPVLSTSNITNVNVTERMLAPKLFESGTGFWDGTRKMERVVYDTVNEVPAVSDRYSVAALKNALVKIRVDEEPTPVDMANQYGVGGLVVMATDAAVDGKDVYMTSKPVSLTSQGGYRLKIDLDDEEGVQGSTLGEYRVFLKGSDGSEIVVRDFSTVYSDIDFDISKALADAGKTSLNAQIVFDLKSSEDAFRYILVRSVELTAESGKNGEQLQNVSFDDATKMVLVANKDSESYWACSGRKGVHNSMIYYCDYTIDTYELVYGNADTVTYSATDIKRWIDAGWCEYDEKIGPESFVRLTDECPIDEVVEQSVNSRTKKLNSVTGRGYNYRTMGYKTMPKFILGTDASGFDLFKRSFAGLRTSLLLGLCTAAFCFAFGLVWGAVSGYFGGNVDLFMERFCEILGGVPWIVVMTLAILHLGNNFFTFFLALCMTGWMATAHRTRTQFYRFKGREYVLASRTLGSSDIRLIFKHILPNSMGTIITGSVLMIPSTIYSEATLAYLNLGLQGVQSFGVMMSNNQQYLGLYPYLVIFPAVIMALMMVSFNLFGNGLRDAFNPSLKGSE